MHIPKHKHHFLEIHKLKHQNQLCTYNEIISMYRLKHNVLVYIWYSHLYVHTLESVSIQRMHNTMEVSESLIFNNVYYLMNTPLRAILDFSASHSHWDNEYSFRETTYPCKRFRIWNLLLASMDQLRVLNFSKHTVFSTKGPVIPTQNSSLSWLSTPSRAQPMLQITKQKFHISKQHMGVNENNRCQHEWNDTKS